MSSEKNALDLLELQKVMDKKESKRKTWSSMRRNDIVTTEIRALE
jgi:hypothetical protein